MKKCISITLLLSCTWLLSFAQRSTRGVQPEYYYARQHDFEGAYFSIMIVNSGSTPVLLKLGPAKRIGEADTLDLARRYACNSSSMSGYYDLDFMVSQENNCVSWYSLQLMQPRDSLQVTVKLKNFSSTSESGRLYCCFTTEVTEQDKELKLYSDTSIMYVLKEVRKFQSVYVPLTLNESGPNVLHLGKPSN